MTRRGTSLIELAVVLFLAALVAALMVPTITHAVDRAAVESAANRIIEAHREARMVSMTSQRVALLRLSADTLELKTFRGSETTLVWRRPGPRSFQVDVVGNPRVLRFIPYGYTIGGSNTSYTLTRGAARRKVIISRLGRVRVE